MLKSLLVVSVLAGCAAEDPTLGSIEQAASSQPGNCQTYGCGANSPEVEGKLFWSVHETGAQPNNENIVLEQFQKNGIAYRADVIDGMLYAKDLVNGTILLKAGELVGSRFTFRDVVTESIYYVTVEGYGETPMWAQRPNANKFKPDYLLTYVNPQTGNRGYLCSAAQEAVEQGQSPVPYFRAVLFDDDIIDHDKLVVTDQKADWFTFGCAMSALAKLDLTAHTKAGATIVGRPKPTLAQRTAFLKLLTADYCGSGHAWTVANIDLHYADPAGYMSSVTPTDVVEAFWSKDGAVCVNSPRVEYSPNPLSYSLFGLVLDDDLTNPATPETNCQLPPRCPTSPRELSNLLRSYAVSANY